MKIKTTVVLIMVVLFTACSPEVLDSIKTILNPLDTVMKDAMTSWDTKKISEANLDRDKDGTWLTVGVRYKYASLKDIVNIKNLEKVTGYPVFVKGPHTNGINYEATEFGHYNPDFLKSVKSSLSLSMANETFNTLAQKFYTGQLKSMTRTYYRAYLHIKNNPDIPADYDTKPPQSRLSYFYDYGTQEGVAGYDEYEASVAPSFWLRRKKDGTEGQFLELINTVLDKYDPNFKKSI